MQAQDADSTLAAMKHWPANWNGRQARPPNHAAIARASALVDGWRRAPGWFEPFVTATPDGDVYFEWSRLPKKLAIYVTPYSVVFLKSWGPDVHSEMEYGPVVDGGLATLLVWLLGREDPVEPTE